MAWDWRPCCLFLEYYLQVLFWNIFKLDFEMGFLIKLSKINLLGVLDELWLFIYTKLWAHAFEPDPFAIKISNLTFLNLPLFIWTVCSFNMLDRYLLADAWSKWKWSISSGQFKMFLIWNDDLIWSCLEACVFHYQLLDLTAYWILKKLCGEGEWRCLVEGLFLFLHYFLWEIKFLYQIMPSI